jgi:ketosteroid isomerase-like protein
MNQEENSVKELMDFNEAWAKAMVANDADEIGSFMADEWIMVSERGISTKEHFLSFVRSGQLTHSMFEKVGDATVRAYGETAVYAARIVNTAHFAGERYDQDEWTSDVFVKRDGKWLCVMSHITAVNKEWEAKKREDNK